MSSYKQIYYQIVFGTKHRKPTIAESHSEELYKYISGIIKNNKCKLYRINGVEDHIHIFSDLHPSVALADYVKDIKVASSIWMKENGKFPEFIEVGTDVFYDIYDYHVKQRLPIPVNRLNDGRMTISFMYTQLLVRVDQAANFVGVPFDRQ